MFNCHLIVSTIEIVELDIHYTIYRTIRQSVEDKGSELSYSVNKLC